MTRAGVATLACAAGLLAGWPAQAQRTAAGASGGTRLAPLDYRGGMPPLQDNAIFTHALLDQAEGRWNGRNNQFRYDAQGWSGTDYDKVWIKSEGTVTSEGRFTDAQHEILYDRAISTYFDLQAGIRVDLDNGPTRTWAAFGIQGLSLYFFDLEATAYVSDRGRFAGRLKASYDLLLTQRLILQPEVEINLYSKSDVARGSGSGVSDIDTGLRLRYEITRELAPYVGIAYAGRFFQSASYARQEGESPNDLRFVFGVRTWF